MARRQVRSVVFSLPWMCGQCQSLKKPSQCAGSFLRAQKQHFSTSKPYSSDMQIQAAPEIEFDGKTPSSTPARIIPASSSYFTASPLFNDNLLLLQSLVKKHES